MNLMSRVFWLALILPCFSFASEAGHIKRMEGRVDIIRNKQVIPAVRGIAVQSKDRIVTGADGAAGIQTADNTLLSLGPNSHLVIDEFAFNKRKQEGNIALRFLKGSFAVVSGLIAKISPERTKVSTPTATIGIRGTEFTVKVDIPPDLEEEVLSY